MTPKQYINSLRLRHICHRIIHSDKSIKAIAQDSGFECYEYFVRVFKKEMGITLNHYIQEFRMKTAADLLTLPNRNVLEIAAMVGFTDVKYFSKCFKDAVGISPSLYSHSIHL